MASAFLDFRSSCVIFTDSFCLFFLGGGNGNDDGSQECQDAIVQTDQRLTFLLHRTTEIKWTKKSDHASARGGGVETTTGGGTGGRVNGKTFADACVQTYIEVQSVGIQVCSSIYLTISAFKSVSPIIADQLNQIERCYL